MGNPQMLSDLRLRCLQRADMVNSLFVSTSEVNAMINASYMELYDLILSEHEDYYVTGPWAFSQGSPSTGIQALPADFYKLKGVDFQLGVDWVTIFPYQWARRNQLNRALRSTWTGQVELGYRIVGTNLHIEPRDSATGSFQLWYIPCLAPLVNDTDYVDAQITDFGWEEYIVIDCAIKMRVKEESSVENLMEAKQAFIKRIEAAAPNRDDDQPQFVSDVSYSNTIYGRGWNGW